MPKITREVVLLSIGFGLLIAMILFTVFGCRCRIERFEGDAAAPEVPAVPAVLTKKEAELFEGLQAGKFSEEQIKTFMKNGVLNEEVIDKFLSKMTSAAAAPKAEGEAPSKEAPKAPAKAAAPPAKVEQAAAPEPVADPKVEQFSTITTLTRAQNTIQKLKGKL